MAHDEELIRQLRVALAQASADAKQAGEELEQTGAAFIAAGEDKAARTAAKTAVERAIKKYENLSLRAMRLLDLLNKFGC